MSQYGTKLSFRQGSNKKNNVISLSSLFCSYSKISKLKDQNIRRTLPTKEKNLQLSTKLFLLFFISYLISNFYF
ncbi:photosystem II protein D1 [Iris pallida]|uniref:Photosystem II protein D1 (Plastid) n=1 Tax=Iris pallida TaxID=29817 RepID=A0AAX6DU00_IRIPA|nr:photosystem II protein D1 [Iris pallida]